MPTDFLLDTHCWVWFQFGLEKKFHRSSYKLIERALRTGRCCVSIVSIWEIGRLASKGRLKLRIPVSDWVQQALQLPGLQFEPLSVEAALMSSNLPGTFHGDPADRMLVATARHLQATLFTADQNILDYGKQGHCLVQEC